MYRQIFFSFQVVFWEDQADRGREEAVATAERARSVPHQRLRVASQRLLPLRQGWRHRQTLSDQVATDKNQQSFSADTTGDPQVIKTVFFPQTTG